MKKLKDALKEGNLRVKEVHEMKDLIALANIAVEHTHTLQVDYHSEYNSDDLKRLLEVGNGMVELLNAPNGF